MDKKMQEAFKDWPANRWRAFVRLTFLFGMVLWGGAMILFFAFTGWYEHSLTQRFLTLLVPLCLAGGIAWGALMWLVFEIRYRIVGNKPVA